MGLMYKPMTLRGNVGTRTLKALMDTGASRCYFRSDEARLIATPSATPSSLTLRLGKGTTEAKEMLVSLIELNGHLLPWSFIMVPELTEELILGADFFQVLKIKLDPETEEIIVDPAALKTQLV